MELVWRIELTSASFSLVYDIFFRSESAIWKYCLIRGAQTWTIESFVKYLFISLYFPVSEVFVYILSGKAKTVSDWNHQTISV